jgi:hypothetical protein
VEISEIRHGIQIAFSAITSSPHPRRILDSHDISCRESCKFWRIHGLRGGGGDLESADHAGADAILQRVLASRYTFEEEIRTTVPDLFVPGYAEVPLVARSVRRRFEAGGSRVAQVHVVHVRPGTQQKVHLDLVTDGDLRGISDRHQFGFEAGLVTADVQRPDTRPADAPGVDTAVDAPSPSPDSFPPDTSSPDMGMPEAEKPCLGVSESCGTTMCHDLSADRNHCGKCNNTCAQGEVCSGGECQLQCGGRTPNYCLGGCVDNLSATKACGAACADCEAVKGVGGVCKNGTCLCALGNRPATCAGACVDLDTNRDHCGQCGKGCAYGEVCSGGTCQLQCGGKTPQRCADACVNAQTNPAACGAACIQCDTSTGMGSVCQAGTCVCATGANPVTCAGLCVDADVDVRNCGNCGHACASGEVCHGGVCQLQCGGTTPDLCTGGCVNAKNNPHACGSACQDCDGVTGLGSVCSNGACACSSGANPRTCDGKCVDADTDPHHCGGCGIACKSFELCSGGICGVTCGGATPQYCAGGCVNAQTNSHACGATCQDCDAVTGVGSACQSGQCACAAGAKPKTCAGRCIDVTYDPSNCGDCGVACAAGQFCSNGQCTNTCLGSVFCGNRCADIQNDPSNCGACGHACAAAEYCSTGLCAPTTAPPARVCESVFQYTLNAHDAYSAPSRPLPTCTLQSDGSATMAFTLPTQEWVACDFAIGVDMNAFDADNDDGGAMEIEFCVDIPTFGPLNLWYGAYPTRKKLELLLSGEILQPGCKVVYKAPENAICHWLNPQWAGDCGGQACAACNGLCNQKCPISFSNARLTLIEEQPTQPITQTTTVRLKSVRFLPMACTCTGDNGCSQSPDRPTCKTGLFQSSICPAGASSCGVCVASASCPHYNEDCVVTLSDRSCPGLVRCEGEKSICDLVDPACAL